MKKAEIIASLNEAYGLGLEESKDLTYENLKQLQADLEKGARAEELEVQVAEQEKTIEGLKGSVEELSSELKKSETENSKITKELGKDAVFAFDGKKYQLLKKFQTGKIIVDAAYVKENPRQAAGLARRFPELFKTF